MFSTVKGTPEIIRIKAGALDRLGFYLARSGHTSVTVVSSQGLPAPLAQKLKAALDAQQIALLATMDTGGGTFEESTGLLSKLPFGCQAVVGFGGARALETAKYMASLAALPFYSVPTSLSRDGFCSPHVTLTLQGRKRTLATELPYAVVIDTEVCRQAPPNLFCAGVGDMVAKLTAVSDWRLAFHARGVAVNDFAAMLSDTAIYQFASYGERDNEGYRLLGTGLMLNGIAMAIAGSTRPAAGSEHLISHALDRVSLHPRPHGVQVGVAAYIVSHLQGANAPLIGTLFERVGFWDLVREDPFMFQEWQQAFLLAPNMKTDFYTILSHRNVWPEVEKLIRSDPYLSRCFIV